MLEAVDALFARQRAHVAVHALVPPGDGDVKTVVGRGLHRPATPGAVSIHQRLFRIGDHEVDDAGGATRQRRRRAGEKVIGRDGAHEGQLHVRVRIDPARHHVLPACVDGSRAHRRFEPIAHRGDATVHTEDVGAPLAVRVDHRAAPDQHRGHLLLCAAHAALLVP